MKKLLSLLVATIMATSLFATTAFAATANVSADFSATEVNIGETFTLTINSAEKTIYAEDVRLKYDLSKFEIVSKKGVFNGNEAADTFGLTQPGAFGATFFSVDYNALSTGDGYSWSKLIGSATTFSACTLAKIELKALEAGTYTFTLEEYSGYSDASDHTGFDGIAGTYTVTVIDPNASTKDEEKTVAANPVVDNDAETKTFAVTVGADLIGTGVTAVLAHPTHGEQEVGLTFDGWEGGAKAVFDVVVKFLDFANAADTTLTLK